jgi:hypothetical protein
VDGIFGSGLLVLDGDRFGDRDVSTASLAGGIISRSVVNLPLLALR